MSQKKCLRKIKPNYINIKQHKFLDRRGRGAASDFKSDGCWYDSDPEQWLYLNYFYSAALVNKSLNTTTECLNTKLYYFLPLSNAKRWQTALVHSTKLLVAALGPPAAAGWNVGYHAPILPTRQFACYLEYC